MEVIYNCLDFIPDPIILSRNRSNIIVVLANINYRKGHFEFLEIVSKICQLRPNYKFIFLGQDYTNGKLSKLINNSGLASHILLKGFV